jgi:hypothetical protein
VTHVTVGAAPVIFNEKRVERHNPATTEGDPAMLTAIIVSLIITVGLAYAIGSGRDGGMIARRPYNNRYNDASGAREDHDL